jgi:hypothetical protein
MYLIVKSNPEKAKKLLKTNITYKEGDKITGDLIMISKLAAKNPDIFELGGVEKKQPIQSKPKGRSKERKKFGPKQDKMFDGDAKSKSK